MIGHHFTFDERKIWSNIKEAQNIMKMIVVNKQLQYKCCPISHEVKATRQ